MARIRDEDIWGNPIVDNAPAPEEQKPVVLPRPPQEQPPEPPAPYVPPPIQEDRATRAGYVPQYVPLAQGWQTPAYQGYTPTAPPVPQEDRATRAPKPPEGYAIPYGKPMDWLPKGPSGKTAYDVDVQDKMLKAVGGNAENGRKVFDWILQNAQTTGNFPNADDMQNPDFLKKVADMALGHAPQQGIPQGAPAKRWEGDLGWIASLVANGQMTEAQAKAYAQSLGIDFTSVLVEKDRMLHRGNNPELRSGGSYGGGYGGGYAPYTPAPQQPATTYGINQMSYGGRLRV